MDQLSYKTVSLPKEAVQKEWWVIDAQDLILGRMASDIAKVIRGKHKPSFTPHIDCGDNVIVINAAKVQMTGKKWTDRVHMRYTGYPGGDRYTTPRELLAKFPERLIEMAVRRMLPKNRLGRKAYKNLHVYAGTEHPHTAQQPKELKF